MANITERFDPLQGRSVFVVLSRDLEDEFATRDDAEIALRALNGPELWELKAGPIVEDRSYVGLLRSVDRFSIYWLEAGKRRHRSFGSRAMADAFRQHLIDTARQAAAASDRRRPAQANGSRRNARNSEVMVSSHRQIRAMIDDGKAMHTRENGRVPVAG